MADGAVLTSGTSQTRDRARKIRLVLMDADGVLTDGRLFRFSDGTEGRAFHARDGLGIRLGLLGGLRFGIVSGRTSEVVSDRARELGIAEVRQGVRDKGSCVAGIARDLGLAADEVCYIGDDLVDVPAFRGVGLAVAPADADGAAREAAHHVTGAAGGKGAVREVVELVLRAQGSWERVSSEIVTGG